MIGADAAWLATRTGVWRRLHRAQALHRMVGADRPDPISDEAALLARTLAAILSVHEPRDGSPYCPGCSSIAHRSAWPCSIWHLVVHYLAGCSAATPEPIGTTPPRRRSRHWRRGRRTAE